MVGGAIRALAEVGLDGKEQLDDTCPADAQVSEDAMENAVA